MALRYYANAMATTLNGAISSGAVTMVVTSITGLPVSFPYTVILDIGQATEEVVDVTAAASTTLTITRAVDATTAFAHATGSGVTVGFSARDLREPNSHINTSTDQHGLTGGAAVVGTVQPQTLTNKTLTDATNVFPKTLVVLSGSGQRTVNLASVSSETQVLNVPYAAVLNAVYVVVAYSNILNNTAGGWSIGRIRDDSVDTLTTGTMIQAGTVDHRLANFKEGRVWTTFFTAPATGTRYVKLTLSSSNLTTVVADAEQPTTLVIFRTS